MKLRSLVTALVLTFPAPALAVQFFCDGKVSSVGLNNGGGQLWVSYGTISVHQICSVADVTNGLQPDTCRAWMAVLLAAQAQDRTIRLFYDSATPGNPSSCGGLQGWGSYSPYFVQTVD